MDANGIDRLYKVILVGDSGVGKTSLLMRLCKNEFKASMTATLGKYTVNDLPEINPRNDK